MHPVSSRSYTIERSIHSVLTFTRARDKASLGVQRPETSTGIKSGDAVRKTVTSRTAWIVTTVVVTGHETENVWLIILSCVTSALDPVVCVLMEEMEKDEHASFRFSTKTDLCMTVCISIRNLGVQRQPTITRTNDGATVFPSVSSSNRLL